MPSKIENPFDISILPQEWAALKKYETDDAVRRVIVLPSFKTKVTSISKNETIKRCDDVVIESKSLRPEYFEYQIGCGFLVLKLDINHAKEITPILQETILRAISELPVDWLPMPGKIFRRLSNQNKRIQSDLPESIQPAEWMKIISTGVRGYLINKQDPFNFLPYMDCFTSSSADVSLRINKLAPILSNVWLQGLLGKPDDDAFLGLTGSHYLDIHFVREVFDNMHSSLSGKFILHIHGTGENIIRMLNKKGLAALQHGELEGSVLFDLIALMNNLATINRTALAMRFIRHLRNLTGKFMVEPIVDQAHHDVFASNRSVYYYNDSQRLKKDQISILPAGYPLADSYLLKPGIRAENVLHGLSHNLKIPVKNGEKIPSGKGSVLLIETHGMSDRLQFLSRKIRVDTIEQAHYTAVGAQKIMEKMFRENILKPVATLQPLLRYHNRRRESPFQRTGIQQ